MKRRLELTVPGTPEEVWDAIATTEGQSAWAFPAEIGEHEVSIHRSPFGPDVTGPVTASERPRRFAYEEPGSSDVPVLAVEFLVEARDHGTCVVRVVTAFADAGEEWEELLDGVTEGWRMSLLILRAYLTHFAGRSSTTVEATVDTGRSDRTAVAAALFGELGLAGLAAGDAFRTSPSAPPLAGTVEYASPGYVLLRVDDPHPALYAISAFPMATPTVSLNVVGHLYDGAEAGVAERWQQWLSLAGGPVQPSGAG
ncbi:SRPBCC family protein [Tenggerimyces flavus]|uniref:SRPBCC domain-containing protein n=1 Tax=Tenggerimyces flavus TaxID=1708749 RepID=A0ABV7Y882_9ACTN|nr:SRPBCC domain-containing protein [Tenggerimyces flavus]MBM7785009.1 uncharacterized protein YndB with AHSA1/START domain [Tenggerimyces flavus]